MCAVNVYEMVPVAAHKLCKRVHTVHRRLCKRVHNILSHTRFQQHAFLYRFSSVSQSRRFADLAAARRPDVPVLHQEEVRAIALAQVACPPHHTIV